MKRRILLSVLLVALGGLASAQGQDSEVHVWPVQGNIYMIVGAGGNITVQTGKDGVLVVDTGLAPMADKVLAAIKTLSNGPSGTSSTRIIMPIILAVTRKSAWPAAPSSAPMSRAISKTLA
jgi:hypothetical protein